MWNWGEEEEHVTFSFSITAMLFRDHWACHNVIKQPLKELSCGHSPKLGVVDGEAWLKLGSSLKECTD